MDFFIVCFLKFINVDGLLFNRMCRSVVLAMNKFVAISLLRNM